jgi:Acyl-CoA reductase (LuxC)
MGDNGGMTERAGYLPGLSARDVEWRTLRIERADDALEIAVPDLSDAQMKELAARVRDASRRHLKTLPVSRIVDIIDRAIARLLDREDPYRKKAEALLPVITGYDAEMVRLGLTGYLKTFRKTELNRFLAEDFSNPLILDDFQPMAKGGVARAFGPDILAHIWAGNVPGLPLWSLISGLLVKAGNIGKVPSAEPLFAGLFAQLLAEIEPSLAECFAIVWWKGGETASETALLREADVVLAYGGNDSLEAIRGRVPITTRYLAYGHKISFGMVSRASLDIRKAPSTAHQAAHDVVRYDQQGCYSPHVFFVERDGKVSPQEFCGYVAHELACFERKYPRRALTIAEASDVAAWRHQEEIKAFSLPDHEIMGDAAGAWSIAYVEDEEDLVPSGLNRTVKIVAVDSLADVAPRIAPYKAFLQTVGIAAAPEELYRLGEILGKAGVTRISALGQMTAPEAGWHHDGRFNLLDLVTLTEIEHSAETAADGFASYVD